MRKLLVMLLALVSLGVIFAVPPPPGGGGTNTSAWVRATGTVYSFTQSTDAFEILAAHMEDNTGTVVALKYYFYPIVYTNCTTNCIGLTCITNCNVITNYAGGSTNPTWRVRMSWYGASTNSYVVETAANVAPAWDEENQMWIGESFAPISLHLSGANATINFTSGVPFAAERYFRLRRF